MKGEEEGGVEAHTACWVKVKPIRPIEFHCRQAGNANQIRWQLPCPTQIQVNLRRLHLSPSHPLLVCYPPSLLHRWLVLLGHGSKWPMLLIKTVEHKQQQQHHHHRIPLTTTKKSYTHRETARNVPTHTCTHSVTASKYWHGA